MPVVSIIIIFSVITSHVRINNTLLLRVLGEREQQKYIPRLKCEVLPNNVLNNLCNLR